jgi:cellulose synthase/poly-beta-1,6-N-acetylglucosamine synthase-like glycosyltransferase
MSEWAGIGIAIPAHDEATVLDRALTSVLRSVPRDLPVVVVVAADACTDATVEVARERARRAPCGVEVRVVELGARCAGEARRRAATAAAERLSSLVGAAPCWIATTDADTTVPADWLEIHRRWARRGADAVLGLVRVDARSHLAPHVHRALDRERTRARFGHGHVYGANLGVTRAWLERVGGFPPVPSGEDALLVGRLRAAGARVLSVPDSVVETSGRLVARAPRGFGARLARMTAAPPPVGGRAEPIGRSGLPTSGR